MLKEALGLDEQQWHAYKSNVRLTVCLADTWTGVAQVLQVVRTLRKQGTASQHVVSGLTARAPGQAGAAHLLALVRNHGVLEHRLPWRREGRLREDDGHGRTGQAPRLLAMLKSFLLAWLGCLAGSPVPSQVHILDVPPLQAVRLLLGSLLTFTSPCPENKRP